jgi:subtilase family serine protease
MSCHPERLERRFAVRPVVEELETRTVPTVVTPAQVRHAYGVDQVQFNVNGKSVVGDGTGQTIAIVVAYNDPNIASDVDMFDKSFAVNSGGWQTLYSQYGASSKFLTVAKPEGNPGTDPTGNWEIETALDVEWAHAIAPGAKILLVEANTNSFNDLTNAVNYARNQPGRVSCVDELGPGRIPWRKLVRKHLHHTGRPYRRHLCGCLG